MHPPLIQHKQCNEYIVKPSDTQITLTTYRLTIKYMKFQTLMMPLKANRDTMMQKQIITTALSHADKEPSNGLAVMKICVRVPLDSNQRPLTQRASTLPLS